MPTFRADPKLGTMVPLLKTADLNDKCVTTEKLSDGAVTIEKLSVDIVSTVSAAAEATENAQKAAEAARDAQEDAERQTMVMEDLQGEIVTALEKVGTATEKASQAAENAQKVANTVETDVKNAKSDIENLYECMAARVDEDTFNVVITEIKSSIATLTAKLDEYCTLAKYTALKEQINTDFDALAKRVTALENQ